MTHPTDTPPPGEMGEANHTPLPWNACCNKCHTIMSAHGPIAKITAGDWGDDYPSIRLVGDSSLSLKAEPYMAQITYGHVAKETAEANAALIVRAVNAYEDLQARITGLESMLCDAQEEIAELRNAHETMTREIALYKAALRPFAEAERAVRRGEQGNVDLIAFARAADLLPEENT